MGTLVGTDASVKLGSTLVADMANWSINDTREAIKAPVFGETFNKVHGMGTRNVAGTISGYLNVDDATGQAVIVSAYEDGTAITTFRLYIDADTYYSGTEVYITSCNISAAQNEVIPVEFSFEASDNWGKT
jgi:predicted secreted protein